MDSESFQVGEDNLCCVYLNKKTHLDITKSNFIAVERKQDEHIQIMWPGVKSLLRLYAEIDPNEGWKTAVFTAKSGLKCINSCTLLYVNTVKKQRFSLCRCWKLTR